MTRLIGQKDLLKLVPYSASHIRRLEAANLFPKRIKIGLRRVAWFESEVIDWINTHMTKRDTAA